MRADLRALFEDADDAFFDRVWADVGAHLRAQVRVQTDTMTKMGAEVALRSASPALRWSRSGQVEVDKVGDRQLDASSRGLTCFPTAFGAPHLVVVPHGDGGAAVHYPVPTPEGQQTSVDLVQRRLRAMAHPVRLRLLESLARGALTTGELAWTWQLSSPEVSRHLTVLRTAGLVTSRREGRFVRHEFQHDAGRTLGVDMVSALLR
jgi:DNA-binding transcriptional ArsR family regulator